MRYHDVVDVFGDVPAESSSARCRPHLWEPLEAKGKFNQPINRQPQPEHFFGFCEFQGPFEIYQWESLAVSSVSICGLFQTKRASRAPVSCGEEQVVAV